MSGSPRNWLQSPMDANLANPLLREKWVLVRNQVGVSVPKNGLATALLTPPPQQQQSCLRNHGRRRQFSQHVRSADPSHRRRRRRARGKPLTASVSRTVQISFGPLCASVRLSSVQRRSNSPQKNPSEMSSAKYRPFLLLLRLLLVLFLRRRSLALALSCSSIPSFFSAAARRVRRSSSSASSPPHSRRRRRRTLYAPLFKTQPWATAQSGVVNATSEAGLGSFLLG